MQCKRGLFMPTPYTDRAAPLVGFAESLSIILAPA